MTCQLSDVKDAESREAGIVIGANNNADRLELQ
jgi:hypothetical protein